MKKNKKMASLALATTMVGSLFTLNVQAQGQDESKENISLPVQFYDYDADGLFYEYALYNGMDKFGLGESNNTGVTKGLVNPTLGNDGLPVYKQNAIEAAANTIHENLLSQKSNGLVTKYSIFNTFSHTVDATGTSYEKEEVLGNESNYFYKRFSLENVENYNIKNGELYTGKGTVWQQQSDGVINYGVVDHLTKEVNVEANQKYTFDCWRTNNNGEIKFKIYDSNGQVLIDNEIGKEFIPTTDKVKIDIYRDDIQEGALKISIPKLIKVVGNVASENYLGNIDSNDKTNFLTQGWTSSNFNSSNSTFDSTKGTITNGETYWKQVGDGVACLKDSSIIFDTDIPANQYVNINYYLGYNGYAATGITIDLLDGNNTLLSHNTLKDSEGAYTLIADANNGEENVKVRINGTAGSRIAAIKINPLGSVLPLGNYEETKNRNPKTVEDCTTCMDYAYLRLNNFYNTNFYLNKKDDKYNKMILKYTVNEDGKVEYTFDSSKEVTYNSDGTFNNDDSGEEAKGFFPLDDLLSDDSSEKLLGEDNKKHNYHFGMKVDGDFIYKKGSNQFFNFTGDDDVYVFINGELAVDLGGAHQEASDSLDIEKYAQEHGIKNGEKCKFQMFYLERHTTASNCKIQTNLKIGNHAEYKFESNTEGMTLPQGVIDMTPSDEEEYFTGTVPNKANKKYADYYDAANKGVWKFEDWDKNSQDITDENKDVQFTGYWTFVKDDFKVTYNFVSRTEGKELPNEINTLLPTDINTYVRNDNITAQTLTQTTYQDEANDGTWNFDKWDKDSVTITNKNENFEGTWVFTPNNHQVTYNFISGTEGKELPDEIKNLLPSDNKDYVKGNKVDAKTLTKTTYEDKANDGTWKFVSWDKDNVAIENKDETFTGTWVFTPNTYQVNYDFVSGTEGKDLPDEIKKLLPSDDKDYVKGNESDVKKLTDTIFEDKKNDGTWKFVEWDKDNVTIENKDESFTGTWVFTPNVHQINYNFVSGTKDKELPDEIKNLLPTDDQSYVKGNEIDAKTLTQTTYEDKVNDGTWKFVAWDKANVTIENKDESFTGTWVFTKNTKVEDNGGKASQDNTNDQQVKADDSKVVQNNKQKESSKVKTGDNTPLMIYSLFVVVSVLGIILLKKKSHN